MMKPSLQYPGHVIQIDKPDFPYPSYAEYVAALKDEYPEFERLHRFFAFPKAKQLEETGRLFLADRIGGQNTLRCKSVCTMNGLLVDDTGTGKGEPIGLFLANSYPAYDRVRIIVINYEYDPAGGIFERLDVESLQVICQRHRIHPEMLLFHFALSTEEIHLWGLPVPSKRNIIHLQNEFALVSMQICENGGADTTTGKSSSKISHRYCVARNLTVINQLWYLQETGG